jgi:hypothetical protein
MQKKDSLPFFAVFLNKIATNACNKKIFDLSETSSTLLGMSEN